MLLPVARPGAWRSGSGRLLSSYGEASRFAAEFTDALTIVAAFPGYWGDVLVAACKGGDRVGRVIPHYEADLEPDYAAARTELCDLLGLDPVSAATKSVAAVRVDAVCAATQVGRGDHPGDLVRCAAVSEIGLGLSAQR